MSIKNANSSTVGQVHGDAKRLWRVELKSRLALARGNDPQARETAENRISQRLQQWIHSRSGTWFSFQPFALEPRLRLVDDVDLKFAFPKIQPENELTFFRWNATRAIQVSDWVRNPLGFQEPAIDHPSSGWGEVHASDSVAGALVPALGFDRQLFRLGRGRGFYDRFLATFDERRKQLGANPIYKIGIGFSEQLVDELPRDDHDVKLDAVVTDREMILSTKASGFAY